MSLLVYYVICVICISKNWKITYSVILSVLSNKTNLLLGFSSPLTRLSNNDNNSEQACSINIVFSCSNHLEQPLLLHQCWTHIVETIMNNRVRWITLFSHDNHVVIHHCSTNNAVTICAIFGCVDFSVESAVSWGKVYCLTVLIYQREKRRKEKK